MTRDLLVFVSGPLGDERQWPENVRRAVLAAEELEGKAPRIQALVPHAMVEQHRWRPQPYSVWMERCLGMLRRCDALYRFWSDHESPGADVEWDYAKAMGIPTFGTPELCALWASRYPVAPRVAGLEDVITELEADDGCHAYTLAERQRIAQRLRGLL